MSEPRQQEIHAQVNLDHVLARLKQACNASQDKNLAELLGISQADFANRKKRGSLFPLLINHAINFKVNLNWLIWGQGDPFAFEEGPRGPIDPERCLSHEDFVIVPLLEGWVAAGPAGEIIYGETADYFPFKRWWIERLIGKRPERLKELFLIRVRGNSMSPTINQGEVILVDTNESERLTIRTGHVYVVVMPDSSIVLKRLAFSKQPDSMRLICMSDNVGEYKPFDFELEYGKSILEYVLGRVRWAGKEFD